MRMQMPVKFEVEEQAGALWYYLVLRISIDTLATAIERFRVVDAAVSMSGAS